MLAPRIARPDKDRRGDQTNSRHTSAAISARARPNIPRSSARQRAACAPPPGARFRPACARRSLPRSRRWRSLPDETCGWGHRRGIRRAARESSAAPVLEALPPVPDKSDRPSVPERRICCTRGKSLPVTRSTMSTNSRRRNVWRFTGRMLSYRLLLRCRRTGMVSGNGTRAGYLLGGKRGQKRKGRAQRAAPVKKCRSVCAEARADAVAQNLAIHRFALPGALVRP